MSLTQISYISAVHYAWYPARSLRLQCKHWLSAMQEAAVSPEAALQALADGQAASLAQLQDNLFGPGAAGRDGGPTAGNTVK